VERLIAHRDDRGVLNRVDHGNPAAGRVSHVEAATVRADDDALGRNVSGIRERVLSAVRTTVTAARRRSSSRRPARHAG
jgi:hypothetical protein